MSGLDEEVNQQDKIRRQKIKEIMKILEYSLHKMNKINDKTYAVTGIKEGIRLQLSKMIQSLI